MGFFVCMSATLCSHTSTTWQLICVYNEVTWSRFFSLTYFFTIDVSHTFWTSRVLSNKFFHSLAIFLYSQGHVVMGTQNISPYQQVIEKTKNLVFRSQALVVAAEKKEQQLKQQAGRESRQKQEPSDVSLQCWCHFANLYSSRFPYQGRDTVRWRNYWNLKDKFCGHIILLRRS